MKKILLFALIVLPFAVAGQGRGRELYDAGRWRAAQRELAKERRTANETRRMAIDFELAHCAANLGDTDDALKCVEVFEGRYPGSAYSAEMHLLAGFCRFERGEWARALDEFARVEGVPRARRDEYFFKSGYAEFMLGRDAEASLRKVGAGEWYHHAQYYLAYSDYAAGRLAAAKLAFRALADDRTYAPLVSYYLLQIEYLEGNYEYVIEHGYRLLEQAAGTRRAEIARVVAEAYFHLDDWVNALRYNELYRAEGGMMGRKDYYVEGYSEYANGYPERAVTAFARVVGPDDKLTQNAAYHMAAAALELDDKRAAMQSFSIAATGDYDPSIQEDARFNNGKLQYELGGGVFNEAINVLQRYIEDYPESPRVPEATEYLAAAYYNSRNFDAAYDAIKRIPNPDNTLRTALQKITYYRALDLYNQGLTRQAYRMFEESARNNLDPKFAALTQFWMGEILYRQGDLSNAAAHFKRYIALAPPSAREYKMALYNLGYIHFDRHEWAIAREWFGKFIAAYPAGDNYRADALNRIGDAFFASREFWRAIENYDAAAAVGTSERYYSEFQRAMALGHVGRSDRKVESLNAIINTGNSPYAADALYRLGLEYISREQFADAAKAMQKYVTRYPDGTNYISSLVDLGLIYQNLDNIPEAIKYYKQAASKAPSSPQAKDAMLALRTIYVARNDVDEYFAFASESGAETDISAMQRDSLAFAAAAGGGGRAFETYLAKYPNGAYRAEALYRAAEAAAEPLVAVEHLSELAAMPYNAFTVRGLERLAPVLSDAGRLPEAAAAWKKLAELATNQATAGRALSSYLAAVVAQGDPVSMESAADYVAAAAATDDIRREAAFVRAQSLEQRADPAAAAAYRALANESRTLVGARATLKAIEYSYADRDLDGAQKLIMQFAEQGAAHQHGLARAFLILGDIYALRGDTFQARATWQSIVDGYSPADDGIVDEARKKIEEL